MNECEKTKNIIKRYQLVFGKAPELYVKMAEYYPELLLSLNYLEEKLADSNFNSIEIQIIMLVYSIENKSELCSGVHKEFSCLNDLDVKEVERIIDGHILENTKWDNLAKMVKHFYNTKWHLDKNIVNSFFKAGYDSQHFFNIIHFGALKVITNFYANALSCVNKYH